MEAGEGSPMSYLAAIIPTVCVCVCVCEQKKKVGRD